MLKDLKARGHDLIEQIMFLGIDRNKVYEKLAKRMHKPNSHAHFRNMDTVHECMVAIRHLEDMKLVQIRRAAKKRANLAIQAHIQREAVVRREKALPVVFLPLAQQRIAIRQMHLDQAKKNVWRKFSSLFV